MPKKAAKAVRIPLTAPLPHHINYKISNQLFYIVMIMIGCVKVCSSSAKAVYPGPESASWPLCQSFCGRKRPIWLNMVFVFDEIPEPFLSVLRES